MSEINDSILKLAEACSYSRGIESPNFSYCYTDNFLIGTFKRSPENVLRPCSHAHEAYEFIIPLSPITNLVQEESVYIGEPHNVYPVHSGRTHGIKYSQSNTSFISVVIDRDFFEKLSQSISGRTVEFNSTLPYSDSLHDYIKNFRNEFNSAEPQDEFVLKPLRNLICTEFIRSALSDNLDARRNNSGYAPGISRVLQYINENYDKPLSVEELASVCGLSKTYFSATFKQIFNTTPKAYVNTIRIAKAKNMLEFTDLPIKKIAVNCGFSSLNTFFCAFRKSTDMTPAEFKRSRQTQLL